MEQRREVPRKTLAREREDAESSQHGPRAEGHAPQGDMARPFLEPGQHPGRRGSVRTLASGTGCCDRKRFNRP